MVTPYYSDGSVTLYHGDCLDILRTLPDASVDSVVTDPPYGLEFMGKEWDGADGFRRSLNPNDAGRDSAFGRESRTSPEYRAGSTFQQWCEEWARECLRVLKPGGHLLAFGGTRTWHRLACAVEDVGFEVRDSIAWLYGSGFPKSLDVSKAIDKAAGAEREIVGQYASPEGTSGCSNHIDRIGTSTRIGGLPDITAPATPDAERWQGFGTALKPAFEPVVVARKPLIGTVAGNVLAHGTGALNIDGCRIGTEPAFTARRGGVSIGGLMNDTEGERITSGGAGRWPANVVLDESQADALDRQSGTSQSRIGKPRGAANGEGWGMTTTGAEYDDRGGASRFFYVAKAPKRERPRTDDGTAHPTVKPLALMRWLVRLVTPPGGVVLEPFAGSGTTVEACILERFRCVAIEREADYLPLIEARIARQLDAKEQAEPDLFDLLGEATA